MPKLHLPSFLSFRKNRELGYLSAVAAGILGFLPLYIAFFIIPYIQYVLIALGLAWIPYSIWIGLCKYFSWKDSRFFLHKKSGVVDDGSSITRGVKSYMDTPEVNEPREIKPNDSTTQTYDLEASSGINLEDSSR
jgi:hypothetical protein